MHQEYQSREFGTLRHQVIRQFFQYIFAEHTVFGSYPPLQRINHAASDEPALTGYFPTWLRSTKCRQRGLSLSISTRINPRMDKGGFEPPMFLRHWFTVSCLRHSAHLSLYLNAKRGIRTPRAFHLTDFQDRSSTIVASWLKTALLRNRPQGSSF